MATPLQWFGLNAVTAANLTLLAMFPLSALAAHWLGFAVTRRHDAAILCGLAYGFCPYRIAHLQHLELLGPRDELVAGVVHDHVIGLNVRVLACDFAKTA